MLKHRGKEKIKIQYEITIERVKYLPKELNGSTIFIEWKRGSKIGGTSKRALVTDQTGNWKEHFSFTSTIYRDAKGDKLESKKLEFEIKEDKLKKNTKKTIGKAKVDLSRYVKTPPDVISIPFIKTSNSNPPSLEVRNNSEEIKDSEKAELGNKPKVEVDGEDFVLKTDSHVSESTLDTLSVISDLENEEFEEDKLDNNQYKILFNELERKNEEQSKEIARLEQEIAKLTKKTTSSDIRSSHTVLPPTPVPPPTPTLPPQDNSEIEDLKQQLEEKILLEKYVYCVQPSYPNNTSITTSNLFRALTAWKILQSPNKSPLLSNIVDGIKITASRSRYDTGMLCYWLSTVYTLIYKVKKHPQGGPWASVFEQQLIVILNEIYYILIHNIYQTLENKLIITQLVKEVNSTQISHDVVAIFSSLYSHLEANHIPDSIIIQVFVQISTYIDAYLFNKFISSKLLNTENAFQLKLSLSQLTDWFLKNPLLKDSKDKFEFKHVLQLCTLLVLEKKTLEKNSFDEIFPSLNFLQIEAVLGSQAMRGTQMKFNKDQKLELDLTTINPLTIAE